MIIKENKKEFIILFIITCIIFLPFLIGHYATDTYNIINVGYNNYALQWSLNDGRIFMSAIVLIAGKLNLSIELFVFITLILGLAISVISVLYLKNIINRYKKSDSKYKNILITAIAYFTIFNFMYIEIMYFVESFVISISVLLYIISADILVKKEKNNFIKSLLLVIIAITFYQGSIGMYFMMILLISILKNKNNVKLIFIDVIKSGIIALIGVAINMLVVKAIGNIFEMEQKRIGSINQITSNIKLILKNMPEVLIDTCQLFPRCLYIIFTIIIIEILALYKEKNKDLTVKMIFIFIMGILSSSVIFILAMTSFYTGRMRLAMGATIGMLFILAYTETDIFEKNKKYKSLMLGLLIAYSTITILDYEYLMFSHKAVNKREKEDVIAINNYIEEYEETTGIQITKIVKVQVKGRENEAYYQDIKNKSTFSYTAIRSELAADAVVNYLSGRKLEKETINDQNDLIRIREETGKINGYCCIGDTFYIEVYMF